MSRNFLTARWENLVMANYQVDPAILAPYLPAGTELDYFDGKTFISLVGFLFRDTRIFGLPVPGMGTFEEINLRFYVKHEHASMTKRGVVFVSETVPYRPVAWMANKLYKEHYKAIPTRRRWDHQTGKEIEYYWKNKGEWEHLKVLAELHAKPLEPGSLDEFILEHYFGYTKQSTAVSSEYEIAHPRWNVHAVISYDISCHFETMFGKDFGFLQHATPLSVILAEGSAIAVKWKRRRL